MNQTCISYVYMCDSVIVRVSNCLRYILHTHTVECEKWRENKIQMETKANNLHD